jgi:hypothetical protein
MNVELDFKIFIDEGPVDSSVVLANVGEHRDKLSDVGAMEGFVFLRVDGEEHVAEVADPLLRLADQWVRKIPWVLGGDTETVAFRDSEHCYAFVPAGDSVEFSFFSGTETEIDEYVIEPFNIRLETFTTQSLKMGERLLDLVREIDASLLESDEDCRELTASLDEGHKAWRDHKLHNKRR